MPSLRKRVVYIPPLLSCCRPSPLILAQEGLTGLKRANQLVTAHGCSLRARFVTLLRAGLALSPLKHLVSALDPLPGAA